MKWRTDYGKSSRNRKRRRTGHIVFICATWAVSVHTFEVSAGKKKEMIAVYDLFFTEILYNNTDALGG